MCAGGNRGSQDSKGLYSGPWDERVGAAGSIYDVLRDSRLGNPVEVIPEVLADECSQVLKDFFEARR